VPNGSQTQWYKNVLNNPSIRINAGGAEAQFDVVAISDTRQVSSVVKKLRAKYGDNGVKLYSKLNVAVLAQAR
jgi:F420H(2)-dependent quinone reductase